MTENPNISVNVTDNGIELSLPDRFNAYGADFNNRIDKIEETTLIKIKAGAYNGCSYAKAFEMEIINDFNNWKNSQGLIVES